MRRSLLITPHRLQLTNVLRRHGVEARTVLHGPSEIGFGRREIAPLHRDIADIVEDRRRRVMRHASYGVRVATLSGESEPDIVLDGLVPRIQPIGSSEFAQRL